MQLNNQRSGFAIVYGLLMLMLVTICGTAILVMSRKSREAVEDYKSSEISVRAAMAGLNSFEGQLRTQPDTSVAIIKKYISNSNYKWLLGNTATMANNEQFMQLDGNSKYSVMITGFDSTSSIITVKAIGYDDFGGTKKIVAAYKLDGVSTPKKSIRSYGFYLGGAFNNVNAAVNITGDVYLSLNNSSPQHFNGTVTINGNLKTGDCNNQFEINHNLTVTGKAYFRCPIAGTAALRVNDKAGFEKQISPLDYQMQLFGDAFFNSPSASWNSNINMNGHKVRSVNIPLAKFINASPATSSPIMNIADSLGMKAGNEAIDTIRLPSWGSIAQNIQGNISASDVENMWNTRPLYQGIWLVLNCINNVTMTGGTFTKKVIWITNSNTININGNWYDCTDESNTLLYVNGSGFLQGMGVPNGKSFRGLIYVNTSSSNTSYQFGSGTTFKGAIEHANGTFNLNSGPLNLDFSEGSSGQEAVQEIADLGIFIPAS